MGECFIDNCQKKEWLRLRKLRLQQVRDLSKDVADEVRRRTEEKRMKKASVLRAQKEQIFEECRKMKYDELEKKYNEAMEKMGLAHSMANNEPDAEKILRERQARNDKLAASRGKVAKQKQTEMMEEAKEKENAPIRRKELTRQVEDIRSGLIVQCRDWTVINEGNRQRQVLVDVPITNVSEFIPREPTEPIPSSPKRFILKSPKSTKTPRSGKPYTIPETKSSPETSKRSPVVPRLSIRSPEKSPRRPHLEFYNRSRPIATYRVDEPVNTELAASSEDEELSQLLKKYSTINKEKTPTKTTRSKCTGYTPPTREHDYSSREPIRRKNTKKNSRNETKKLFKAIDKALEEGRKLQEEVSKSSSSIRETNSDSDDDDTVVKLTVNLNCGHKCSEEKSETKNESIVEKINVGTETGPSLDEGSKPKIRKKKHFSNAPIRSSTFQDLSQESSEVDMVFDVSSIKDEKQSAWSSSSYLQLPQEIQTTSFKVNPFLDYYIRKLLAKTPISCTSSSICTDCKCNSNSNSPSLESPPTTVSSLDIEEEKRLKKIGELKKMLQQIRSEQQILHGSSSTSSESTIRNSLSTAIPNVRDEVPVVRKELSTIIEVDSKLQLSDPPDLMEELLRRKIISEPFNWSQGASLSDIEREYKENESVKQATMTTMSSYHPNVTHIDNDWVPNESTFRGSRLDLSLSESSFDFSN